MSAEKQRAVEITVDGRSLPGPWQTLSGREITSEVTRVAPGHMLPARVYAGQPETSDINVERIYDLDVCRELYSWMKPKVGSGEVTITEIYLDSRGHKFGTGDVWTGLLSGLTAPNYDATSGDTAKLGLTFVVEGP